MQVIVLCNNHSKEELADLGQTGCEVVWIKERNQFLQYKGADAWIDLLFENEEPVTQVLQQLLPRPVIINSVTTTTRQIHHNFVRINGWPGFLKGKIWEANCESEQLQQQAGTVFSKLGKSVEWLADEPGFVTPKVISMIVNEAFFALEDGVSTKREMDTAMKLGTNYPYGPFEWADLIGLQRIVALLQLLSQAQPRYAPSKLLLQELAILPPSVRPTA